MALILKKKLSKSPRQQVDEVLRLKRTARNKHAWFKFFGKVEWSVNPVTFQRGLRDE